MLSFLRKIKTLKSVVDFLEKAKDFQKEEFIWIPLSFLIIIGVGGLLYLGGSAIIAAL